jgi:hypothetical protein
MIVAFSIPSGHLAILPGAHTPRVVAGSPFDALPPFTALLLPPEAPSLGAGGVRPGCSGVEVDRASLGAGKRPRTGEAGSRCGRSESLDFAALVAAELNNSTIC